MTISSKEDGRVRDVKASSKSRHPDSKASSEIVSSSDGNEKLPDRPHNIQLAEEESRKVAELRPMVSDHLTPYYDTDFNLARWIQGYPNMELKEVASRLRTHLKLRYN